jgi:hypothetical protein
MTAALELSTNQITHFYSPAKNTVEMIRLLDLLVEQCAGHRTPYFSWGAASWHASKELAQHVSDLNTSLPSGERRGPRVELAPLPACAQFPVFPAGDAVVELPLSGNPYVCSVSILLKKSIRASSEREVPATRIQ